jgi:hypothetical protein
MASTTKAAARLAPYVEQLIEDEKARKELQRGASKLRDAYGRSRKRRVKTTSDKKLRKQLLSAAESLGEGAKSTVRGAQEPKRRGRRILGILGLLAAAGIGIAFALNEDLRNQVLGTDGEPPAAPVGDGIQS